MHRLIPCHPPASEEVKRADALFKTGALQDAIFNSENFTSTATDAEARITLLDPLAE